ncbi:MAG: phenylacetate-CoA oxygenase subunit PaaJ [Ardenticatenales bacterium]|nr:phenylacetate-CoA oxygenase subunit PaaJ [Ardenticatenales bacterium]
MTPEAVWDVLRTVNDPEIPMVSVVDLGIIQAVVIDAVDGAAGGGCAVRIDMTPTFTGCPALDMMRTEIAAAVASLGAASVEVRVVLDPPWSSDRIAPAAREAMRAIGLAPPPPATRFTADPTLSLTLAAPDEPPTACPFCGSMDTVTDNPFGSTLCRSVHYCNGCRQPFEAFKAL